MKDVQKALRDPLCIAIVPAVVAGIVFELWLGHRHDYTGHFLAGYGGTLGAAMVCFRLIPADRFSVLAPKLILPLCWGCVLLGVGTEATIFRIAKFDEIDFFNQSLGAVLAMIAAIAFLRTPKMEEQNFDYGLVISIFFLGAGGCYAVA